MSQGRWSAVRLRCILQARPSTNSSQRRPLEGSDSISVPVIVAVEADVCGIAKQRGNRCRIRLAEVHSQRVPPLACVRNRMVRLIDVWAPTRICAPATKVNTAATASGLNQPHLKPAIQYLPSADQGIKRTKHCTCSSCGRLGIGQKSALDHSSAISEYPENPQVNWKRF